MASKKTKTKAQTEKKSEKSLPNVLYYDDYRSYLKDYYEYQKKHNPNFSLRYFAIKAGLKSHANIQRVLNGARGISYDTLDAYVKALRLKSEEAAHFALLVQINKSTKVRVLKKVDKSDYSFPQELLLYNLVRLRNFRPDPKWINKVTHRVISRERARTILNNLIKHKLIQSRDNKWVQSYDYIEVNAKLTKDKKAMELQKQEVNKLSSKIFEKAEVPGRLFWSVQELKDLDSTALFEELVHSVRKRVKGKGKKPIAESDYHSITISMVKPFAFKKDSKSYL